MPSYDYVCRNEECEEPAILDRVCSVAKSKVLPQCPSCGSDMPKAYLAMPNVSWRYIAPSGKMKTSNMGPSQRADRRHAGWDHKTGQKVLQPIYKSRSVTSGRRKIDIQAKKKK